MNEFRVKRSLNAACEMLKARDAFLLERKVGERALVAKLASYLAPLFRDYDVDVEYNKHGVETKTLMLPVDCRGGGKKRVFPDIVVHRRGHDKANLLAVEVKKVSNREPRVCDRAKLAALKTQYGYVFGVLLEVPSGTGALSSDFIQEWQPGPGP